MKYATLTLLLFLLTNPIVWSQEAHYSSRIILKAKQRIQSLQEQKSKLDRTDYNTKLLKLLDSVKTDKEELCKQEGIDCRLIKEILARLILKVIVDINYQNNQKDALSAYNVINDYEEEDLRQVFWQYGELRNAPKLASTIVQERNIKFIKTSEHLKKVLAPFLPKHREHKILAQIYQAIRIEVNQEIEVLKEFLMQTEQLLDAGGRISLISYHSLEDRLVKRYVRSGMFQGEPEKDMYGNFEVPFKKVGKLIIPDNKEIKLNNRARSAKLRIAEKL